MHFCNYWVYPHNTAGFQPYVLKWVLFIIHTRNKPDPDRDTGY